MNEYEIKVLQELLETNSNKAAEAIKTSTFNLARVYNTIEEINDLLRNQQAQDNRKNDKIGLIK
jgi:transcriptional antiterminator